MLRPLTRLLLPGLLVFGSLPAFSAPEFDSQDPVEWAVRRLQETPNGPKLKLWEPRQPGVKVARNADGTVRNPGSAFPDGKESLAVLKAAEAFLKLGRRAMLEERGEAFTAVCEAAQRWARFWTGDIPEGLGRREGREWVKALQSRMIANPAVPRFNEFVDPHMQPGAAAEVDVTRSWRVRRGKGAWHFGREEGPISVTYDSSSRNTLDFEVTRLHEWVHVVDEGRMGAVDGEGRRVRDIPENPWSLFTEAKAYAIDYEIQRTVQAGDDTALQASADELEKPLESVTFEEYFMSQVDDAALYPWSRGLFQTDLKTRLRQRWDAVRFNVKEKLRALRGNEVKYLRTIVP